MKDINELTGIEFEHLCQALLQNAGFDVETTKASGDGGIDLIARNNQHFFSGKYIVQCKRYIGSVGEPVVRDLYGVVTAERANKGILLTTGHFTVSAVRFASDKNLELIDGDVLAAILAEHKMGSDSENAKLLHFTQFDCFDKRKYDFYKTMVNQNKCTCEMGHDFLFEFMFKYMEQAGTDDQINEMLNAGFAEEYIQSFAWYTRKYFKNGKENLEKLPHYINKYNGIAQLLNFDLFEYIQNRYKILSPSSEIDVFLSYPDGVYWEDGRKFGREYYTCSLAGLHKKVALCRDPNGPSRGYYGYEKFKPLIMKNLLDKEKTLLILDKQQWAFFELMNMLSIFSHFKLEKGINVINHLLYGHTPEFRQWFENQAIYQQAQSSIEIYYCSIYAKMNGKKYNGTKVDYAGKINLDSYFKRFERQKRDKLTVELAKIETLLDTLV